MKQQLIEKPASPQNFNSLEVTICFILNRNLEHVSYPSDRVSNVQ